MASDLISRSALEAEFAGPFVQTYKECRQALREAPAVDAVELVRCKDCVYWRDRHVLTPDGQRKSYAEMPPEAFNDDSGLGVGAVTCAYGINCGSRCEIDCDSGYGVDKSVFREAGDFCSRGVKKDAVD